MRKNRQSAFTLIELVVVMAMFSIVVGTSIVLLFEVFEFHDRYEERTIQDIGTDRLVRQFRDDVHGLGCPETSINDEMDDENVLARWTRGEKTVVYTLADGKFPEKKLVIRTEMEQSNKIREDSFSLPDNATLWFANGTDSHEGLAAMSIWIAVPGVTLDDPAEFDPFTRKIPERLAGQVDPKHPGAWRTIVAAQPK